MNGPLNPNILVGREYRESRPREEIDADAMTKQQRAEIWPELHRFIIDPATSCLFDSLFQAHHYGSDEDRAERAKRRKEKASLRAEMRMEIPR